MGSLGGGASANGATGLAPELADYVHPFSIEQFRKLGYEVIDMICDYYSSTIETVRVLPDVQPGYLRPLLAEAAPDQPEPFSAVKKDFLGCIMKGVTHWQSPRFFGWFHGNTSIPSLLAEMLISALNNVGFSWQSSPVSTELEMVMMDWLARLCGLPDKFLCQPAAAAAASSGADGAAAAVAKAPGGVIQGTSSEAVLVAMLAARARALDGQPPEAALRLVAYASTQTHSCLAKAGMVLGLQHTRLLEVRREDDYALRPSVLADAVAADLAAGLLPFYFVGTIGTTSTCAVDPIPELAEVCHRHNIWFHVDAAWGGSASIVPEQRRWFKGLDAVDSFSFNPHKWLLTNFDCCACWFDDSTYLKAALSLTPAILRSHANAYDYKDWQVPLGRRFRSLKLFFVLRMYGAASLQDFVRHKIALGEWVARQVQQDNRFELAAPPRFGLTAFRLAGQDNAANKALLEAINHTGELFMVSTELDGLVTLRISVGQTNTQLRHVQAAWRVVSREADAILARSGSAAAAAGSA